ncbi:MAG: type I pullulanase [Bacillota bacterium]|nr:type I pullulanase [Bacillota bacterium]
MKIKRLLVVFLVVSMLCVGGMTFPTQAATHIDYASINKQLDSMAYNGNDLGANYSKASTTFKVWSPNADKVQLKLYATGSDSESAAKVLATKDMKINGGNGVWSITVKGDLAGKYYTYLVTNSGVTKETVDIYAKAAGVNGNRGMIVDLNSTNPQSWNNDKHVLVQNSTDASVWEVQIKDFSYDQNSGVTAQNRGKYLAFTEQNTTLNSKGKVPTCINYLKSLGIKYVQLNPFYDFGSVDEAENAIDNSQYNWGYDPKNYNVPEGSFSSNPYDGNVRINECKQMIQALHNAGIGVIMDVVYNHTYDGADSWFNDTVPNYYYRIKQNGTWSNGSGCGNDTASERAMFRKYMIDSVTYWASEYHVDGFRFDLMGLHDVTTMNSIRAALDKLPDGKQLLMYGEAWNMNTYVDKSVKLANQSNMKLLDERIGAFNDTMRNGLRGPNSPGSWGFLQGKADSNDMLSGFAAATKGTVSWARVPSQTVNYASCHDNMTLYDKLASSVDGSDVKYDQREESIVAMNKLSAAITISSQGIPFMLAGEEFGRSKNGNENSYKSSPAVNMIDWSYLDKFSDVQSYYNGMLEIRNAFLPLRDSTMNTINASLSANTLFQSSDSSAIGYQITNTTATNKSQWKHMALFFNSNQDNTETVKMTGTGLPKDWVIIANDLTAGVRNLGKVNGNSVNIPPCSALILVDKASFDAANIKTDQGLVIVKNVDKDSNKVIGYQAISGKIGSDYQVSPSSYLGIDYDYKRSDGSTFGNFTKDIIYATQYFKKYTGAKGTVTIKFIDEDNNQDLCNAVVMNNRVGQQYYTSEIPAVINFALDMNALPQNGAGLFTEKDITVVYKYKMVSRATQNIVNVIYMDNNGKILKKSVLTNPLDQTSATYQTQSLQFNGLSLVSVPQNMSGTFSSKVQNVLYVYALPKSIFQQVGGSSFILFMVIGAAVLFSGAGVFLAMRKAKKVNAEIDEELYDDEET